MRAYQFVCKSQNKWSQRAPIYFNEERTFFVVVVLLGILAFPLMAQDYPKAEVFGGYSIEKLGLSDSDLNSIASGLGAAGATDVSTSKWLKKGFIGSFTYNATKMFGIEGDFRWNRGNIITANVSGVTGSARWTDLSVLGGPRVTFRASNAVTPFVHALVGLDHATIGASASGGGENASTSLPSDNNVGVAAGGGLDLKVNKAFAIRVIQADYYFSRHYSTNLNNLALSFGAVFHF